MAILMLKLDGTLYEVSRYRGEPSPSHFRHVSLVGGDREFFDVCISEYSRTFICSCKSGRQLRQLGDCEHTEALREVGLLPRGLRPLHAPAADQEEQGPGEPTEADLAEAHEAGRGTWGGEDPLW